MQTSGKDLQSEYSKTTGFTDVIIVTIGVKNVFIQRTKQLIKKKMIFYIRTK